MGRKRNGLIGVYVRNVANKLNAWVFRGTVRKGSKDMEKLFVVIHSYAATDRKKALVKTTYELIFFWVR